MPVPARAGLLLSRATIDEREHRMLDKDFDQSFRRSKLQLRPPIALRLFDGEIPND
jgi:hypothetical protein